MFQFFRGEGIFPIVFQNGKSFVLSCNSKRKLECFREALKNKVLLNEFCSVFQVKSWN